jgi:hypothetical protein
MRIQILENIYERVCESRMMYGAEIWGLDEGWKEMHVIHRRLCKKILEYLDLQRTGWLN